MRKATAIFRRRPPQLVFTRVLSGDPGRISKILSVCFCGGRKTGEPGLNGENQYQTRPRIQGVQ